MRHMLAILLVAAFGCTSTAQEVASESRKCKTDVELAAEAEAAAKAVEQAIASGKPLPTRPQDASKTPAQLAQEAALEAAPCGPEEQTEPREEIPQIDRVPTPGHES